MRILVINPNTSEEMTRDIADEAQRYARPGTMIETVSPAWGPRSIEGHYDDYVAAVATLEMVRKRAAEFDGVVIACFGDPGLFAAREVSPVPVVGIAEASMLVACTIAHRFSVVTVLPRVKPWIEDTVRLHGLDARCASVRTTPLTVLDCECDPAAAQREIVVASRLAIEEDGAEAICLGCAGMGALGQSGRGRARRARPRRRGLRSEAPRGPLRLRGSRRAGSPPSSRPRRRSISLGRSRPPLADASTRARAASRRARVWRRLRPRRW